MWCFTIDRRIRNRNKKGEKAVTIVLSFACIILKPDCSSYLFESKCCHTPKLEVVSTLPHAHFESSVPKIYYIKNMMFILMYVCCENAPSVMAWWPHGTTVHHHPFVQRIKPLLDDEERELKESVAYFQQVSEVFQDAVDGTDNPSPLASSTYIVFDSWTKSLAQHLEARMEQISTELQNECNADEEDDHEHA